MSEFLVPIAISSQLDVTGEERIHAAKYTPTVRAQFIGIYGDLPDGYVGDSGSFSYSIVGATGDYELEVTSGSLPPGAVLDEEGNLTYEFTDAGTYSWTITLTDSVGLVDTVSDSVTIGPMTLTGDLDNALLGDVVSFNYTATHGVLPRTFSITSGSLPTGLSMNSAGHVAGTTSAAGSYSWQVTVTDDAGNTAVLSDSADVFDEPSILGTLPDGELGDAYSETLSVIGGDPPYSSVSISSGALPAGLSIGLVGSTITVSGTPV